MSPFTYHHIFLVLHQSTALNKTYVLRGQKNTIENIQNGPRHKRNTNAIMVQAYMTMRLTSQTYTKVGHTDLGVSCGRAFVQRIKGMSWITS